MILQLICAYVHKSNSVLNILKSDSGIVCINKLCIPISVRSEAVSYTRYYLVIWTSASQLRHSDGESLCSKMTNSVLYYVISLIATFYLCYGVSSNQPLSSHSQPGNVMISILPGKPKVGTTGTSCAIKPRTSTTSSKRNNIRETFFTRMNEHNTEAFNLLNQLWHSKSGWQHVNTKEGIATLI